MAAPELIGIEVLNALRRLEESRAIPPGREVGLPDLTRGLRMRKYGHDRLLDGIRAWRRDITACDAAYVVPAQLLGATLVTRDRRLAKACDSEVPVALP